MHYRWSHDNFPFIFDEFGGTLFPGSPRLLHRMLGKRIGARFAGFLPMLGIPNDNHEAIENRYENDFLPALN